MKREASIAEAPLAETGSWGVQTPPAEVANSNPGESQYAAVGRCGVCLRHIEALQPGGGEPRHIADQSHLCKERTS